MDKKLLKQLVRDLFIGFVITIFSPLLSPYTVTKMEQLSDLRFGFPFRFIIQQSYLTPPEEYLPLKVEVGSLHDNPTRIITKNFILSIISISLIVIAVDILLMIFIRNRNTEKEN